MYQCGNLGKCIIAMKVKMLTCGIAIHTTYIIIDILYTLYTKMISIRIELRSHDEKAVYNSVKFLSGMNFYTVKFGQLYLQLQL